MRKALRIMAILAAFGLTAWIGVVALAQSSPTQAPTSTTVGTGDEFKGNCDEAEHVNDPECVSATLVAEDNAAKDNNDDQGENDSADDNGADHNDDQGENESNDDQGENDDHQGDNDNQGEDDNSGPSNNSGSGGGDDQGEDD